jgi:hypothetical protein
MPLQVTDEQLRAAQRLLDLQPVAGQNIKISQEMLRRFNVGEFTDNPPLWDRLGYEERIHRMCDKLHPYTTCNLCPRYVPPTQAMENFGFGITTLKLGCRLEAEEAYNLCKHGNVHGPVLYIFYVRLVDRVRELFRRKRED